MGLRTASVRHPHVMVMAPALTKANQSQNFKLSPKNSTAQSATPLDARDECTIYHAFREDSCEKDETLSHAKSTNGPEDLSKLVLVSELLSNKGYINNLSEESSLYPSDPCSIMNSSPLHMGDHKDKMGLQKSGLDISTLVKEKTTNNDVDQLLTNIEAVLPGTDIVTSSEIGQNVDELMQVFKSIESGNDRLGATTGDLGAEVDSIFPLTTLSSLEKELFNDVDVMGISMEEQLLDGSSALKENHSKEFTVTLQRKHAKLERKLEFLLRRLRKLQAKNMGQHISEEIAGVFEHVHRTLRRAKDNTGLQSQLELIKPIEPSVCASVPATQTEAVIPERLKPISQSSAKNLVRKLEMSAHLQANSIGRQRHATRYFGSGSVESNSLRNTLVGATIIPQWTPDCKQELIRVSGLLHAETRLIQDQLDSEATVSSSGGESCDEMQTYNNPHQQYLSIQKRAAWRYATERAAIAARWDWLQAQISDLEYRIRQYTELHKQIRTSKGTLVLGGASPPHNVPSSPSAVNGYRGQLPGASPLSSFKDPAEKALDATANGAVSNSDPQTQTAARTRPMVNFRKRKLLQTWGLHAVSKKASRSSTIRCGCVPPHIQCALCTGRTDPTRPRDLSDYLSKSERISSLDPCFHPVYSLPEDTSAGIHLEAIMKTPEWQHRSTRPSMKTIKFASKDRTDKCNISLEHQPKKPQQDHRRKYNRLIKSSTINALTAKIKNKFRGRKSGLHSLSRLKRKRHSDKLAVPRLSSLSSDSNNVEYDQIGSSTGIVKLESRSSSPLLSMQTIPSYKRSSRISSYDIDNIVIPYSVAASTRVEKLQYKEILTPKWRMIDPDFATKYTSKNNGLVSGPGHDSDVEDFSDEVMALRHEKCALEERNKFLSYMKHPSGTGRPRSHKRTDSRAESSGCNTPDPMSPHTADAIENTVSPLTSPPATPLPVNADDTLIPSTIRKRTVSQSRSREKETIKEETSNALSENDEVVPYDKRVFPLTEETYDTMLKLMPENHQFQTNVRAQDNLEEVQGESPDSESTESAIGDEDPNDPEWIDMENIKDRYNRR